MCLKITKNFSNEVIYLRHWSTLLEAVLPLPLSEAYCATYNSEENFPKLLGTHVYKNCHKANVNEHGEWQWMYHLIWNQWWQEQRVGNKNQQKSTLFDVQVITGKLKTHDTEAQKNISMLTNWTTWRTRSELMCYDPNVSHGLNLILTMCI